jgi:hypothetical protein
MSTGFEPAVLLKETLNYFRVFCGTWMYHHFQSQQVIENVRKPETAFSVFVLWEFQDGIIQSLLNKYLVTPGGA